MKQLHPPRRTAARPVIPLILASLFLILVASCSQDRRATSQLPTDPDLESSPQSIAREQVANVMARSDAQSLKLAQESPNSTFEASVSFTGLVNVSDLKAFVAQHHAQPLTLFHAVGNLKGGYELEGRSIDNALPDLVARYEKALDEIVQLQTWSRNPGEPAVAHRKALSEVQAARGLLRGTGVRFYGLRTKLSGRNIPAMKSSSAVRFVIVDSGNGTPDPVAP